MNLRNNIAMCKSSCVVMTEIPHLWSRIKATSICYHYSESKLRILSHRCGCVLLNAYVIVQPMRPGSQLAGTITHGAFARTHQSNIITKTILMTSHQYQFMKVSAA